MTEDKAREAFLSAYTGMHSYSTQDWSRAMEAEPFAHLGDAVLKHPAFRCLEEQENSAGGLTGLGALVVLVNLSVVSLVAA